VESKPNLEELYLKALENPLRRRILGYAIKREKPLSPARISEALDEELSLVSYHVRELRDHSLLILASTRPVRGSTEHFYTVDPVALAHPIVKALDKPANRPPDPEIEEA